VPADVVVATDVVYDGAIVPALVEQLVLQLMNGATAFVASAERNKVTLEGFLHMCRESDLLVEQVVRTVTDPRQGVACAAGSQGLSQQQEGSSGDGQHEGLKTRHSGAGEVLVGLDHCAVHAHSHLPDKSPPGHVTAAVAKRLQALSLQAEPVLEENYSCAVHSNGCIRNHVLSQGLGVTFFCCRAFEQRHTVVLHRIRHKSWWSGS
jgi:hypothetical protein